jgi:hypothetical protein
LRKLKKELKNLVFIERKAFKKNKKVHSALESSRKGE